MLPILKSPIYTLTLPSTGKPIQYGAFLVRDEKILALAIQDGTPKVITETLKQIIKNCTFGQVKVDDLASFDIEYLFLNLRSKSKGNMVELRYTCKNVVDGVVCDKTNPFSIDLDAITVDMKNAPDMKIMLDKTVGLMMKYPNLDSILEVQLALAKGDLSVIYDNMSQFVECVFEGKEVDTTFTPQQFSAWLETLSAAQFKKIENFFINIPSVVSKTSVCCSKCQHKEDIVINGLHSFLA